MYLSERLKKYAEDGILPMHMPGHKRNFRRFPWLNELGCLTDITEVPGYDDLNEPSGIFKELNELAADVWGADGSICMVNGSTGAILAAVRAVMRSGGRLLISRGCHRSVYNAAELCCCETEYIVPCFDGELGIWGSVTPEEVETELKKYGDIKLCVITSPTYEGVISDVKGIADVCHRYCVPLLVDEAHGAHLGFGNFPKSAVRLGADIVVQSLHKTLPSLTQTAIIHVNGGLADIDEIRRNAAIFESSSPSYILSSSCDGCVRYMSSSGDQDAERWLSSLKEVHSCAKKLKLLKILCYGDDTPEKHGFFSFDPSKLVITTTGAPVNGAQLAELMRAEKVEPEMASCDYVVAMTGMGDDNETIGRFCDMLLRVDEDLFCGMYGKTFNVANAGLAHSACGSGEPFNHFSYKYKLPEKIMRADEALSSPKLDLGLGDSLGKISAEYAWIYPPGTPVIVPGEIIDGEVLALIKMFSSKGIKIHSSKGNLPNTVSCVDKLY